MHTNIHNILLANGKVTTRLLIGLAATTNQQMLIRRKIRIYCPSNANIIDDIKNRSCKKIYLFFHT
jgi:hypothetical protein